MKKKVTAAISACLSAVCGISLIACGPGKGENLGTVAKGDRTEISFTCISKSTSEQAWINLITAYNDGQGLEDDVYVTATFGGSTAPSSNLFTKSASYASNVVAISDSQDAFQKLGIMRDSSKAPNGYFVNLQPYADADEDFQNNSIPDSVLNWWRMQYEPSAKQGSGQKKHVVGADQNLMGVPYGANAHFNWYNSAIFKAQGVNIVSIPEEQLEDYNTEHSSNIMPHGYAEYKTAPLSGMTASKNLSGETVYKVFNNCIGMNWEEQRNFLKYFSPEYNDGSVTGTAATTKYGFISEYWFNYGWSVGGDVMGFNGTDYDFTLLDKNPNYIVTADNTKIGNSTYNAGEIVRYEDRVQALDNATTLPANVYAIESQYNAIKEFVSLQVASNSTVDSYGGTTYKGYGVASPDTTAADNLFNTSQLAMVRGTPEGVNNKLTNKNAANYDMCVPETYREYEGGSVYYVDAEDNGFASERLMVIGEKYDLNGDGKIDDNEVYTGEIKVVNGTKIIGNTTSASISQGLVIPACSDSKKYQAAWDFISWVATDGQKYLTTAKLISPIATDVLFSDDYIGNENVTQGKNFYAIAKTAASASRGDWGYFENGKWVTNWSTDFNSRVRKGTMTLSSFSSSHASAGKSDLNNMYTVIKGIR